MKIYHAGSSGSWKIILLDTLEVDLSASKLRGFAFFEAFLFPLIHSNINPWPISSFHEQPGYAKGKTVKTGEPNSNSSPVFDILSM